MFIKEISLIDTHSKVVGYKTTTKKTTVFHIDQQSIHIN